MTDSRPILIGNSFPLSLIRTKVVIEPCPVDDLRRELACRPIYSFWGHRNTLAAANQLTGADLMPATDRPALQLSAPLCPVLGGIEFDECWILSPDYVSGYRPAIGEEVEQDKIVGWQVLRLKWTSERSSTTEKESVRKSVL